MELARLTITRHHGFLATPWSDIMVEELTKLFLSVVVVVVHFPDSKINEEVTRKQLSTSATRMTSWCHAPQLPRTKPLVLLELGVLHAQNCHSIIITICTVDSESLCVTDDVKTTLACAIQCYLQHHLNFYKTCYETRLYTSALGVSFGRLCLLLHPHKAHSGFSSLAILFLQSNPGKIRTNSVIPGATTTQPHHQLLFVLVFS